MSMFINCYSSDRNNRRLIDIFFLSLELGLVLLLFSFRSGDSRKLCLRHIPSLYPEPPKSRRDYYLK